MIVTIKWSDRHSIHQVFTPSITNNWPHLKPRSPRLLLPLSSFSLSSSYYYSLSLSSISFSSPAPSLTLTHSTLPPPFLPIPTLSLPPPSLPSPSLTTATTTTATLLPSSPPLPPPPNPPSPSLLHVLHLLHLLLHLFLHSLPFFFLPIMSPSSHPPSLPSLLTPSWVIHLTDKNHVKCAGSILNWSVQYICKSY